MKLTTKIVSIKKDIAKNGKTFYRVGLGDGTTAFAWNWGAIAKIKLGEEATLTVEKQGNFLNIKNAVLAEGDEGEPTGGIESEDISEPDEAQEEVYEDEDVKADVAETKKKMEKSKTIVKEPAKVSLEGKELAITRMSCLKTAVEYIHDIPHLATEDDVIGIAQRFEDYVRNGK